MTLVQSHPTSNVVPIDPAAANALNVLDDPPGDGAVNMARDETLLELAGRGALSTTLRLYEWQTPTISLGYFQRYADYRALSPPARDLPVVRRLTGGGAILHDRELTYALAIPIDHPIIAGQPTRLYELVHQAVIQCFQAVGIAPRFSDRTDESGPAKGPFFCFARRHRFDLLLGADKVAGSAQRRTRHAVLQHGSVIFERRFDQQPTATAARDGFDVSTLRRTFPATLADVMALSWRSIAWPDEGLAMAESLTTKYAGNEWTRRR